MSFSINLGDWNSIFAVPTNVVDKHIKLAGAAQLKVLLWILRYAGTNFNIDDIASSLSMHKADANDALQYWVETGLISYKDNTIIPHHEPKIIDQNNLTSGLDPKLESNNTKSILSKKRLPSKPQQPDPTFVAKRIEESEELSFLMQEAQVILGRMISNADCATLLMIHDNDGLPPAVIIMLLQYAVSKGKKNMKYIEKMAISWAEEEIDSIQKAEQKIRNLDLHNIAWRKFEKILGIDHRSPTSKEDEMVNRWINDWKYGEEMILEAYERCVNAKGKYVANYIDSIIKRWHKEGIVNIKQAMEEKSNIKSQKYNVSQRKPSYDIEEYERSGFFENELEYSN